MFERLSLYPKNCKDCCKWLGVVQNAGICGASRKESVTSGDHEGCRDQLSVEAIRASYRYPELVPKVTQIMKEIEWRERDELLVRFEIKL